MSNKSEEILKKVKRIEISTRKTVDTMLSGQYHTRFKGLGMQFSDFREYAPGDDIRHIDWKVTARTASAHIRKFEEERDLTVYIVVDVSKSGVFGSVEKTKFDAMVEICALLSFAAIKNNDRVGLIMFSDQIKKHVPPKKGHAQAMRLITELLHYENDLNDAEKDGTNIRKALDFVAQNAKHSGVIFLASDFYDFGFENSLKRVGKKHDVIALRMKDPREVNFPKVGKIQVQDAESGSTFLIDTSSASFRNEFKNKNMEFEKNLNDLFLKANVDRLDLMTNEDYFSKVVTYFRGRKRK